MPKLITEWSTDDKDLAKMLQSIAEWPEYSIERMELEVALHQWQASWLMKQIGVLQHEEALRHKRRRKRDAS